MYQDGRFFAVVVGAEEEPTGVWNKLIENGELRLETGQEKGKGK